MYFMGTTATPAVLDTGAVDLGRWASVVISMALLFVAGAAFVYTSNKPTRVIIGVGAIFAFMGLAMRVVLLFSGTG